MCNRFHQSEKAIAWLSDHRGIVIEPDITWPPPKVFPTGMKTARHAFVVRRSTEGNAPLVGAALEWGVPTKVPGKKPGTWLNKFVTNARNLDSKFWRSMIASPDRRCLVPFSHFAEPHPDGGKGDDGQPKQAWFSLPQQPIGMFAGLWRPVTIPSTPDPRFVDAFAFATCAPNDFVMSWHPKAMPVILAERDWNTWLMGTEEEARGLVSCYIGPMEMQVETPPI